MAKAGVIYNGRLSLFLNGAIVGNPPLAAGDVRVVRSDGTVANAATLPSALPGDTDIVVYTLSAVEMAGDPGETVTVKFEDQTAPRAWEPVVIDIPLDVTGREVWEYITRTLTQGAASIISAVLGDNVTVYRDAYWYVTLTGLTGDLTDNTEVYLAIKNDMADADTASILLVSRTGGIERINGAAPVLPVVAGDATLTVLSATSVRLTVNAIATALILPNTYYYGVKRISAINGQPYLASEGGQWRVVYATVRELT